LQRLIHSVQDTKEDGLFILRDLEDFLMVKKPTYEELEQRVNGLSNKLEEREQIEEALRASEERFRLLY